MIVLIILILLAAVYLALPFALNSPQALSHPDVYGGFWAPDTGARFAMIRNWVEHGSLIHLNYPYSYFDPTGQIHPLAYFLFHRSHDFTAMYSPLFPFLCGLAYRAFGFAGLTLVPALCGLGCVFTVYKTARRLELRSRLVLLLVLGLATPLVIYSSVLWDHSAIMLVVALAGYWMLRAVQDGSLRSAIIVGILVGLGMWLHEQFLAFFVAIWLAALPFLKSRRPIIVGLPFGFFTVVLLWAVFNWRVYGAFAGPHLGANVFQNNTDHPFGLAAILNLTDLADRAMAQVVGTTLPGSAYSVPSNLWIYYLAVACLLIFYTLWSWESRGTVQTLVSLALGLTAAALALYCVISIHRYATPAGLFQATPLLIPALAVPWYTRHTSAPTCSANVYCAWLSRTCWLFLLFLLINPMYPGTDWGSRYLLSALPLLVLLSARALEWHHESVQRPLRGFVLAGVTLLIGMSLVCQVFGLVWIRRSVSYSEDLNAHLRLIRSPVLITDADFNARLVPRPLSQARFLVRTDADERILARILRHLNIKEAAFVGFPGGEEHLENAITYSGRTFIRVQSRPLFIVNTEREAGDQFQFVRYILKPESQAAH